MASSMHYPSVRPFDYVLIPCDDAAAIMQRRFNGRSEEELRATLRRHFRQQLLSDEQRQHMTAHLLEKANEKQAHTVGGGAAATQTLPGVNATSVAMAADADGGAAADVNATAPLQSPLAPTQQQQQQEQRQQQQQLIQHYLDEASFEIVPVTMPTRETRYVGTSLYIDDSGAFKDLPLNARASALAQRPIRGDAFLLSNHDDPALDEWGRVDCTTTDYETLRAHPPQTCYDTSNRAQMAATTALRESEAKRVTEQDARNAADAKAEGNRLLTGGDVHAAVQAYTRALDLTEGRRDLLADEAAATQTRVQTLLNRSLAYNKLRRYNDAANDARAALALCGNSRSGSRGRSDTSDDHSNDECISKAFYRLATALIGSRDYDGAMRATHEFVRHGGDAATTTTLRATITSGAQVMKTEERARYARLFT